MPAQPRCRLALHQPILGRPELLCWLGSQHGDSAAQRLNAEARAGFWAHKAARRRMSARTACWVAGIRPGAISWPPASGWGLDGQKSNALEEGTSLRQEPKRCGLEDEMVLSF